MTAFTFVQAADLHLDAPLGALFPGPEAPSGLCSELAREAADLAREAGFRALSRLVDVCLAVEADFLLLAGDVYNSRDNSLRARLALRDAFVKLGRQGVTVFMVHGNHDPFKEEKGIIPWPDNVHVFGKKHAWAKAVCRASRQPAALIGGISHAGPREETNLVPGFGGLATPPDSEGLMRIGLLHCAVRAVAGGHSLYAPCAAEDLVQSGMDYWALGHVHAPRVLDMDGRLLEGASFHAPLAAYSGSLQGLHVNEAGPRGCLVGRVGRDRQLRLDFAPLAPLQWEQLSVTPDETVQSFPALERLLLQKLEALTALPAGDAEGPAGFLPQAIMARIRLEGTCALDAELRRAGSAEDLRDHLNAQLADTPVFVRDIKVSTRPCLDPADMLQRRDLAGEVLRVARALAEDPQALTGAASALEPFFGQRRIASVLDRADAGGPPRGEESTALVEEAAYLCLELLEAQAGAERD